MKRIALLLITILIVGIATPASAAEITPDPASYTLGSTSEFSEPAATPGTLASDDLADTGQSRAIVVIIGTILAVAGTLTVVVIASRQKRLAKR